MGVRVLEHLLKELASSLVECQLDDYSSLEGLEFLRLIRCLFEGTHGLQQGRLILIYYQVPLRCVRNNCCVVSF